MTAARRSVVVVLLAVAACEEGPEDWNPSCGPRVPVEVDPAGDATTWVVDSVQLPANANEAAQFGLNVDCDPHQGPDNAFGQVLAAFEGQEAVDLNGDVARLIEEGRLLHLLRIQAVSLDNARGAGVTVLHGLDTDGDPADNFDGDETFGIDTGRGSGLASGTIEDGTLRVRGGPLPVALSFPIVDDVVVVPLGGARIEATLAAGRIEGRIGGGITVGTMDQVVYPFVLAGFQRAIDRDCTSATDGALPCGCAEGSYGEIAIRYFDELPDRPGTEPDGDCRVLLDEFLDNSIISSLLATDVDLFDAEGELNPRVDGVADSLSIGMSFTAVPAQIAP